MTDFERLKKISQCWKTMGEMLEIAIDEIEKLEGFDYNKSELKRHVGTVGILRFRTMLWNYEETYRIKYLESLEKEVNV